MSQKNIRGDLQPHSMQVALPLPSSRVSIENLPQFLGMYVANLVCWLLGICVVARLEPIPPAAATAYFLADLSISSVLRSGWVTSRCAIQAEVFGRCSA